MSRVTLSMVSLLVVTASILGTGKVLADNSPRYRVTITNLTRGQQFTPILVASHKQGVSLFKAGDAASPELAILAEEGDTAPPAPHADVREIMTKELTDFPGKEGLMLTVTYPPGGADEIHRHDAHAFLYVLEGSIVMQVKGGPEVTLKPGESFYEGPNDLHIVGRNASATQPAKFVVVLIKNKGAPPVIPVK